MKTLIAAAALLISLTAFADQPAKKDTAVVQDMKTGQKFEVRVPRNALDVKQTGPHDYTVHVNRDAMKKVEVTPKK